jgi:membrane-associated phospholipid phosphatase
VSSRKDRPVPAAAVLIGLASARLASRRTVGPLEERVFRWANGASDRLHLPVWAVMQSGSLGAVFAVAALQARRPGSHRAALVTALVGTGVWGGVKAIKPAVGRGRPDRHLPGVRVRGHEQSGLGYPSGHAAVSLTLALAATHDRPPVERVAAVGAAAVTGWTRMYVGAHLPLDIVGGWAVGVLGGAVVRSVRDDGTAAAPVPGQSASS